MKLSKMVKGLIAAAALAGAAAADTQGRGEGGIIIADNVPVYKHSDGGREIATATRGDTVGAVASVLAREFVFNEKNGRVQVMFFAEGESGLPMDGWIDPTKISKFSYDCSCSEKHGCMPTRTRGLRGKITMNSEWNTCFREARDAHLAELKANNWGESESEPAGVQTKTVELGQTVAQVEEILGPPQTILKAGGKIIYVYSNLKITFEGDRVTDLQ